MLESWIDISDDGFPVIDWYEAVEHAMAFDGGARDYDSALGKLVTAIQQEAFDAGYRKGLEADKELGAALLAPAGHA